MRSYKKPPQRIEDHYDVDLLTGCWIWIASLRGDGYGIKWVGGRKGRSVRAHRWVYEHVNGIEIADGMVAMHLCDNPPCVNPSHIRLGTQAENLADMATKKRSCHGSGNHHAVITEEIVLEIRSRCERGESQASVARGVGISTPSVCRIVNRKTWRHVP